MANIQHLLDRFLEDIETASDSALLSAAKKARYDSRNSYLLDGDDIDERHTSATPLQTLHIALLDNAAFSYHSRFVCGKDEAGTSWTGGNAAA